MITINEKYIIRALPDCYVAEYKKSDKIKTDKKTGMKVLDTVVIGYYGQISGAFTACKDDAVRRDIYENDYTLQETVERIVEITNEFKKKLFVLNGKEEHI